MAMILRRDAFIPTGMPCWLPLIAETPKLSTCFSNAMPGLDVTGKSGSMALHLAASRSHCHAVELLISKGANTESVNSQG